MLIKPPLEDSLKKSGRKIHFSTREETFQYEMNYDKDDVNNENGSGKAALWYSKEERDAIKSSLEVKLKQIVTHSDSLKSNSDQWCTRGLEYVLEKRPRDKIRLNHKNDVLDFYRLICRDADDGRGHPASASVEESLARFAQINSFKDTKRARAFGLCDQRMAMKIQKESVQAESSTANKLPSIPFHRKATKHPATIPTRHVVDVVSIGETATAA